MGTIEVASQSLLMPGISSLHNELLTALSSDSHVILDLGYCSEIDLSFIQTVESGRKYASSKGFELTLAMPAGKKLRDLFDRSGLSATFTPADRSFWLHEG